MPNKNSHKPSAPNNSESQVVDGLFNLGRSVQRKKLSRKTKIKFTIAGALGLILAFYLIWDIAFHGPLTSLLSNRDQLVESVRSFGIFAPFLYIIFQIIQTVAAPIPGQIVGSVGGFLFGAWGILWTMIGSLIGCLFVFKLARRFGRPLLEKIFKQSVVTKFDFIINAKSSSLILFAIFLLPGFPDDVVCYIAGLTKVPISRLMFLVGIGRLPTIILTNLLGDGLGGGNFWLVAGVSLLSVVLLLLALWKREWLIKRLKGDEKL